MQEIDEDLIRKYGYTPLADDEDWLDSFGWGAPDQNTTNGVIIPTRSEEQIKEHAKKILNFIAFVHPHIKTNVKGKSAVEIRAIGRPAGALKYISSVNVWDTSQKAIEHIVKLLEKVDGQAYCLYYSTYSFDNFKPVKKIKGKEELQPSRMVMLDNAKSTQILLMDLDKITEEEYQETIQQLRNINIYTTDIATGNGYQCIIKLNQPCTDLKLYKKFTDTMLRKGFKVDSAIVDAARVARLPNTYNTKAADPKFRDTVGTDVPFTKTLKIAKQEYPIEYVFAQLETLEDKVVLPQPKPVKAAVEPTQVSIADITTLAKEKPKKPLKETVVKPKKTKEKDAEIEVKELQHIYPMLNWNKLMDTAKLMLSGAPSGYRNKVVMFLLPYLKNELKLSKKDMVATLTIWGNLCTPTYENAQEDVDRYLENYATKMTSKYGRYADLEDVYGPLKKDIYRLENGVNIPNMVLKKLGDIKDGSFRTYLMMKREQHLTGKTSFTLADIQEFSEIERRTFFNHMKELTNHSLVRKVKSAKKNGEEYYYEFNMHFERASRKHGYTSFEAASIWAYDKMLTDGELKLYIYLVYRIRSAENEFKIDQTTLGKSLKKTQHGISMMTDELNKKKFIRKNTWYDTYKVPHTDYVLIQ